MMLRFNRNRLVTMTVEAMFLAGFGLAPVAMAAFPPPIIVGVGGTTEVDPPPTIPPVCDPPQVSSTPEPGTMALAALGAGTLAVWNRRREKSPRQ